MQRMKANKGVHDSNLSVCKPKENPQTNLLRQGGFLEGTFTDKLQECAEAFNLSHMVSTMREVWVCFGKCEEENRL